MFSDAIYNFVGSTNLEVNMQIRRYKMKIQNDWEMLYTILCIYIYMDCFFRQQPVLT